METKYYVDNNGNYLGGFGGSEPPKGSKEVPNAPAHGLDKWVNGAWVAHVPEESKQEKLSKITVTTQSGITFDGNEAARTNIMGALKVAEITGQTSTNWKVANNDLVPVTIQDLEEALTLAMLAVGRTVGAIE